MIAAASTITPMTTEMMAYSAILRLPFVFVETLEMLLDDNEGLLVGTPKELVMFHL